MRLVFPLQSVSICHFSGSRVEIIFTANKIIQKRNDGESAKAVREQVLGVPVKVLCLQMLQVILHVLHPFMP